MSSCDTLPQKPEVTRDSNEGSYISNYFVGEDVSENEQLMQIQRSDDRLEIHLHEITVVAGKYLMPCQKTRCQLD